MIVLVVHCWDETNAYGHEFGFHGCDVHGLGMELVYDGVAGPNVGDSCCNIGFLNTTIGNDGSAMRRAL